MDTSATVLVVGAGPTGLTVAMELTRLGVGVRLVDKRAAAATTSRALAVQARTLELFDRRGLTEQMLPLGNPARAAALYSHDRLLGKEQFSHVVTPYPYILMLSQAETERLLTEKLAGMGVQVERSCEMIAFSQTGSGVHPCGVRAILRRGDGTLEEVDAAWMIAAEGAHSSIRQTMDLHFEGETLPQKFLLGDLHIDGDIPEDEISLFLPQTGFLALFPMRDHRFRMIAAEKPEEQRDGEPTLDDLQAAYNRDSYIPGKLRDLVWSSHFAVNSRMLKQVRQGRVFFGGDSAHVHSPAGGQGMNTGIQDMIDLGWKLAMVLHGTASSDLLDTYESDRIPVIRGVLKTTETMTGSVASGKSLMHDAIIRLLPFAFHMDFVQKEATGILSQTKLGYRESTLSTNHDPGGSFRAGDRIPCVQVSTQGVDGNTNLQTLVDAGRLTLFADTVADLAAVEAAVAPWDGLIIVRTVAAPADPAETSMYADHFGTNGFLLLCRPDSYAGFVGSSSSQPQLLEWLNHWFPIPAAR